MVKTRVYPGLGMAAQLNRQLMIPFCDPGGDLRAFEEGQHHRLCEPWSVKD